MESAGTERLLGKRPRSLPPQATDLEAAKKPKIPRGGRRGTALLRAAGVTKQIPLKSDTAATKKGKSSNPRSQSGQRKRVQEASSARLGDPFQRQPLPRKLSALKDIFIALQTVYEMLRRRGKRTTYSNMKTAVEEASGRRFLESHLHQLQAAMPDTIVLESVDLPIRQGASCTSAQTLVTIVTADGDTPFTLRENLHHQLARHLLDAYAAHLRATARELHAAGEPTKAAELEQAAQQRPPIKQFIPPYPDAVPDIGSMPLFQATAASSDVDGSGMRSLASSPHPVNSGARVTFSVSTGQIASGDAEPAREKAQSSFQQAAPVMEARKPRGADRRRLSFAPCLASVEDIFGKTMDENQLLESMPEELRRRSLEGGISLESLRMLECNEAVHRRLSTAAAREARDVSATLGALPRLFTQIQRIFGAKGPSAMKLDEVVQRVRAGGPETSSEEDSRAALRALAHYVPEYVQLKPWGRCGTPGVWINRKCATNAVAAQLKAVAEQRREAFAAV